MVRNKDDVLEYVIENDVKFVRLQFCDIFGTLKNISIMPSQLEKAFDEGICFDASSIKGFLNTVDSDLMLFPDPCTMSVLPWRPQQGRVVRFFCNVKRENGEPFEGDSRRILQQAILIAENKGYSINFGPECEFFLFETDSAGKPTPSLHDNAGYFEVAPLDKGENVRREICLTLEEMGLDVESSHHETGAGQHEISFRYADALTSADNLVTFKTVVKTIASRNGLYASFMPKPLNNISGSGLHINMSLIKDDINLFEGGITSECGNFIAGILAHIKELCAFSNPLINSYKRLSTGFQAPRFISWSHQNRSQLIRIPAAKGQYSRMELRNPDPSCNPYLVFALLINAGMDGIEKKMPLQSESAIDTYTDDTSGLECLPTTLFDALIEAQNSTLVKNTIGERTFTKYFNAKLAEWKSYCEYVDDWETAKYFGII